MITAYLSFAYTEHDFCIRYPAALSKQMHSFWKLFSAQSLSKSENRNPALEITITPKEDAYLLSCQGKQFFTDTPMGTLQNLLFRHTVYQKGIFPLHAGGVAVNGKAVLFLAATGTGKTTLITYLSENGFPYLSDDKVLLSTQQICAMEALQPIHLRPESLPILRKHGFFVVGETVAVEKIHRIVYLPKLTVCKSLPIGGIFFVRRTENENACMPISPSEAVQKLMLGRLSVGRESEQLKCAIRLAPLCRQLSFCDLDYVKTLLQKEVWI